MPSSPPEETSAERSISSNIARWGTKGPSARSPAARYAFAVFAASAGILISLWLRPFSYGTPFLYLYPMVLIAVWFGGFWPGLVATVLTSLGANYFFLAPYNHFSLDTAGLIRTLMFAFAFASLCYFIDLARAQLEARLQERTAELSKAKEAAWGSEARLAGIIDSAMDAIITVDEQQRIVLFNPAAEKMFGRRAAEVTGQSLNVCIPQRFRAAHAQHHRDFAATGLTRRHIGQLGMILGMRASCEEFPLEISISQVDVGGRKLFTAILRDITQRVAAEEALRSSETRFRSLVEHSSDAIALQDAEGKILYASPPVERVLGYRPEEFVGQNVSDLIHPEEHEKFETVKRSLLHDSCPVHTHFRTRHKDGSWRIIDSVRSNQLANPAVCAVVVNFRDATEAVAAEEALRRQAALFDQTYDAVFVWEWKGTITFWNRAAQRLYGYSRDEAVGRVSHELLKTKTLGSDVIFLVALKENGEWEGELEHTTRDGRCMTVESRMTMASYGEHTYVLEITRDITERKRAEDEVRRSEARLQLALSHANAGIWEWDVRTNQNTWSEEVWKLYGLEPHSCEPSHEAWLRAVHPQDRARAAEKVRKAASQGSELSVEYRTSVHNGELRWLLARGQSIRDAGGSPTRYLGVVLDITERKRAEAALRESEERLQKVTEGMTEGLVISDMEGNFFHWNPAAIEMHGFSSDEDWHRQLPEFQHIFELSTLYGTAIPFEHWPLPRILRGERLRECELRVRRIDRDWERVFSYGGTIVSNSLGNQIAFCTIADITERKRAEEEVQLLNRDLERRVAQRTAELQAANKELESFSYSVAHDLRAPLRAVDGFSDALLEDYGPQLPEEARKYLETIRGGAQRMGCLVDDLLAFSRLGRQPLTKQPVDMEALVRGVLEDVIPDGQKPKIEIVNGNLPAAHGDPSLLRQVWANLLSNAIKYSRHAQQARIEIGALAEAQGHVYFVRDNGAGFDMKYADKLFGVFQRLHRADEFEGTGIGLAIVQRVIHRHGGRVWAEAKLNEGATFYFTLEGGN